MRASMGAHKTRSFKRLTKLIISIGYFLFTSAAEGLRKCLAKTQPAAKCVVLQYHSVAPPHRSRFARQMDELLRWSTPIAAGHSEPLRAGERYAAVTFDDGFECVIENAIPELTLRRIPATLFIVSNSFGSPH